MSQQQQTVTVLRLSESSLDSNAQITIPATVAGSYGAQVAITPDIIRSMYGVALGITGDYVPFVANAPVRGNQALPAGTVLTWKIGQKERG